MEIKEIAEQLVNLTVKEVNELAKILKDEYKIWVCPNGGELRDSVCRVGHIGNLTLEDNDRLIDALKEMRGRGII